MRPLWSSQRPCTKRNGRFFLINLSHDNLANYYQVNFQLMNNYSYSLDEVESMLPWEREIYLSMLIDDIKEKNERAKQKQG